MKSSWVKVSFFLFLRPLSTLWVLAPSVVFAQLDDVRIDVQSRMRWEWAAISCTSTRYTQPTANCALNAYFKDLCRTDSVVDYNTCVDRIIQISPCYDLSGRAERKGPPQFTEDIESGNRVNALEFGGGSHDPKQEPYQIDLMGDFKFDGGDI
jgi:hypothetical protein